MFTSPDDHLVTPVPAGTYREPFCGFRRPSESETGVVNDTPKPPHSGPVWRVSDYRGSYYGNGALSTAGPTGDHLRRRASSWDTGCRRSPEHDELDRLNTVAKLHDSRNAHPLLGLHFRNVLGDALRAERGLARRLSRVTRRPARHRVRPELVHVLRNPAGATVHSRVGRGDDVAGSARSSSTSRARERPIPSRRARCRPWSNGPTASPRCSTISGVSEAVLLAVGRRVRARGAVRGDTSVAHHRAGRARRLRRCGRHPTRSRRSPSCDGPHVGQREDPTCGESGHAVERGDPGNVGSAWNVWRRAQRTVLS